LTRIEFSQILIPSAIRGTIQQAKITTEKYKKDVSIACHHAFANKLQNRGLSGKELVDYKTIIRSTGNYKV